MNGEIITGPLANRTVSGFPLSIGTGMAFESLFLPRQPVYDPERKLPPRVNLQDYKVCYINLATLFRNIVGAVRREDVPRLGYIELKEVLMNEVEVICSLFVNEGRMTCVPYFYFPTYDTLYKRPRHQAVQMRRDNTDNQKFMNILLMKTMDLFFKENPKNPYLIKIDCDIQPDNRVPGLLISHCPYDLLSHRNFTKLDLLESHTGVLKPKAMWWSKFYNMPNTDLSSIPFNRQFLQIFGDRVLFSPLDIRFRRLLVDISIKRKWTQFTTDSKILLDLDLEIKERFLFEMYRAL